VTSLTIVTDGVGNDEVQLPTGSISGTEVLDNSIGEADIGGSAVGTGEIDGTEVCSTVYYGGGDPTEAGATDDYISLWDHGMSTTEGNEDEMRPNGLLKFHSMSCLVDVAPGSGDDWTIVLRDDGGSPASGSVTCLIADTAKSCISTDSAAVVYGSLVNLEVDSSAGSSDPTAAALIECVLCGGH
jgi:hypothetical protein